MLIWLFVVVSRISIVILCYLLRKYDNAKNRDQEQDLRKDEHYFRSFILVSRFTGGDSIVAKLTVTAVEARITSAQ